MDTGFRAGIFFVYMPLKTNHYYSLWPCGRCAHELKALNLIQDLLYN